RWFLFSLATDVDVRWFLANQCGRRIVKRRSVHRAKAELVRKLFLTGVASFHGYLRFSCRCVAGRRKAELVVDCTAPEKAGLLLVGRPINGPMTDPKK